MNSGDMNYMHDRQALNVYSVHASQQVTSSEQATSAQCGVLHPFGCNPTRSGLKISGASSMKFHTNLLFKV